MEGIEYSVKVDLYILISIYDLDKVPVGEEYIMIDDLAKEAQSKEFIKKIFRYKSVYLVAVRLEAIRMPFFWQEFAGL